MNYLVKFIFFVLINLSTVNAKENIMILKLKTGDVKLNYPDVAPNHVNRIKELANEANMTMWYFIESSMDLWLKQVM